MSKISDLSLLVYLAVVNHKSLPKVMSNWSGCEESFYNEKEQVELIENTISEISSVYHCPLMFHHYFEAKRYQKISKDIGKFEYTDLDVVRSPLHWIEIKTWDEEDTKRLKELRKEYNIFIDIN